MIHERLDDLSARLAAAEAFIAQVMVPLLSAAGSDIARELLARMRDDFVVEAAPRSAISAPVVKQHIERLVDTIEAGLRAKHGSHH